MSFFPDIRTVVTFGSLSIKWYAVILIASAFACYYLSLREFRKMGYKDSLLEDFFLYVFIIGIIGARLWFCVFYDFEYYFSNPLNLLKIYEGGLAIQGGLVAGAIYAYFYFKKHKVNFFRAADAIVPNILVASTIGRWANFINQEAYGPIVDESFYNLFPSFIKNMMFINGSYRMPTFLMESVGCLIGFLLIYFVYKKYSKPKRGDLAYAYLMWYGIIRTWVESFRTDSLYIGPIKMAQLTALSFLIVGIIGTFGLFRKIFKSPKPVILWDLDGTLLDTEPAILETYRRLFVKYDKEENWTKEKQLEVLGPALKDMFEKYFPGKDVQELISEYRKINYEIHPEYVKPMENCEQVLKTLHAEGYKMGIVSTKMRDSVKYGLSLFGLENYFDVIVGEGDVEKGKPAPDGIIDACKKLNVGHDELIYIGDSKTDIMAAKNAGAYSVGYIFNEERKDILLESKPNVVINDLTEVLDLVKKPIEWTYNEM